MVMDTEKVSKKRHRKLDGCHAMSSFTDKLPQIKQEARWYCNNLQGVYMDIRDGVPSSFREIKIKSKKI